MRKLRRTQRTIYSIKRFGKKAPKRNPKGEKYCNPSPFGRSAHDTFIVSFPKLLGFQKEATTLFGNVSLWLYHPRKELIRSNIHFFQQLTLTPLDSNSFEHQRIHRLALCAQSPRLSRQQTNLTLFFLFFIFIFVLRW